MICAWNVALKNKNGKLMFRNEVGFDSVYRRLKGGEGCRNDVFTTKKILKRKIWEY